MSIDLSPSESISDVDVMQLMPKLKEMLEVMTSGEDEKRINDELRKSKPERHARYIRSMTTPHNDNNVYLHDLWRGAVSMIQYTGSIETWELLDEMNDIGRVLPAGFMQGLRTLAIGKVGYAVPNEAALSTLKNYAPIVEIGAGVGYWAMLSKEKGIDYVAIDNGNEFGDSKHWVPVLKQDGETFLNDNKGCPGGTLFLCWPRQVSTFVDAFRGQHVIWIGEEGDGATATMDEYVINEEWEMTERVIIPTWPYIRDVMHVYRKREKVIAENALQHSSNMGKLKAGLGCLICAWMLLDLINRGLNLILYK